ncbi:MAG: hypothetical protein C0425_09255 [Chlorobiaceae bacterium]|nr:hypothetical protein [Chlorobiaceae bacterium]MBA4310509.1 hypothetical protein [Chlorobiaceae bacterium]
MMTLLLILLISTQLFGKNMELPIIPNPKQVKAISGNFSFPNNLEIYFDEKIKDELKFTIELLSNSLKEKYNATTRNTFVNPNKASVVFSFVPKNYFDEHKIKNELLVEAYELTISKTQIKINAVSTKGLFYGVMSLLQLIEKNYDNKFECVEIIDFPDLKVRGISDDISRGQVSTLENFKKIIEHIARYKMNTYMPYLEDMILFDKFPTIGVGRGALTKGEIKELIAHANKFFVEVIPIFQTLGHYENILAQDEFLKYAEFPGAASLCVACDETYIFLEEMLKVVFELFPSEYFHMGADESWDVGLGKSKHLVEKYGIAKVHADHYKKVYDICKKYSKKVMMYGDIILDHPEILELIPKDIIIVDWHYRADDDYPSTKKFNDYGFEYFVSPSVWNFLTTFPTNINALPNIYHITKAGIQNGADGMINSNWGDYGAETIKELVLFGYVWSAQCSWNIAGSDLSKFSKIYFYDFFGIDDARLSKMYETFSNSFNQMMWHEVWRHPLLTVRNPEWWEARMSPVGRINWMNWTMPNLLKDIEELKPNVEKNRDHLDILNYFVRFNNWYKMKLETQLLIDNEKILTPEFITLVEKNIAELKTLRDDYKTIWLRYYKPENLNMIMDKFNRLIYYFEESKNNLESPLIKSDWIYVKNSDTTFANFAEFQIQFNLDALPEVANIQLLGNTYAKLFINDEFVGHVHARRSLSLLVDYERILFLDIKKYLRKGENKIFVEVENYNTRGSAGFNLASNIIDANRNYNIDTKELTNENFKWQGRESGDKEWENVNAIKFPFDVIAPNFKTKRTSWIER